MPAPGAAIDLMAIFNEALEQPSASARAVYLDRACVGDQGVRARVEILLEAHERAVGFLESPAQSPTIDVDRPTSTEAAGKAIGPYKLMEQIGEGGMGAVYVAEQVQPVRRKVALKIIKPGMDTKQVVARFEAERQALAMMDHPNIAKVLDAGTTDSGRPYFVMELVRGVPITDYCDREHLSIPGRLDLFVLVCRAVQHAHQKGIIHRDIKPTNVLVTLHDGVPLPKVIDFGIAKATGQSLTDRTLYTGFAQLVGTPLYMSPEQAEMSGLDVDTRSDVYSLGVLLYELLTGTTPFDRETMRKAALDEMRRIIREEEPPKPSTRLSALGDTLTTVSARRKVEPRHLSRAVRGELDWIVMKALEKDRNRRYETANDFAADVMRHLTDRPVEACPPSALYRLGKAARRNRASFTTAALVAAALAAGTGISLWQAGQARTARRQAEARGRQAAAAARLARRAVDHLYDEMAGNLFLWGGSFVSLPAPFLEGVERYYEQFAAEPVTDTASGLAVGLACRRLGDIHKQRGQNAQATAAWRRGVELLRNPMPDSPEAPLRLRELAMCHFGLGEVGHDMDEKLQALALRKELVQCFPTVPEYRRELGQSHFSVGIQNFIEQRYDEAIAAYSRAQEVQEPLAAGPDAFPDDRRALGQTLRDMANALRNAGRKQEAEPLYLRATQIHEALVEELPGHPVFQLNLAWDDWEYGVLLAWMKRPEEALERQERAVTLFGGLVGKHPDFEKWLGNALARHCVLRSQLGHVDALQGTIARVERFPRPERVLAFIVLALNDEVSREETATGEILELARSFLSRLEQSEDPMALNTLAWCLATFREPRLRDPVRAVEVARRAVAKAPESSSYRKTLGIALYRAGDWQGAIEALEEFEDRNSSRLRPYNGFVLAMAHARRGEAVEARRWYDRAVASIGQSASTQPELAQISAEAAAVLGVKGPPANRGSRKSSQPAPSRRRLSNGSP